MDSLLTASCGKVAHGCLKIPVPDRHSLNHTQTKFYPNIGHSELAIGKVVVACLQRPYHKQSCCNQDDFHDQILNHRQMCRTSIAGLGGNIKRGIKVLVWMDQCIINHCK